MHINFYTVFFQKNIIHITVMSADGINLVKTKNPHKTLPS